MSIFNNASVYINGTTSYGYSLGVNGIGMREHKVGMGMMNGSKIDASMMGTNMMGMNGMGMSSIIGINGMGLRYLRGEE